MTYKAIAKWPSKDGKAGDFHGLFIVAMPKTRELKSCLQIDLRFDEVHPKLAFMTQDWESSQDHKDLCLRS